MWSSASTATQLFLVSPAGPGGSQAAAGAGGIVPAALGPSGLQVPGVLEQAAALDAQVRPDLCWCHACTPEGAGCAGFAGLRIQPEGNREGVGSWDLGAEQRWTGHLLSRGGMAPWQLSWRSQPAMHATLQGLTRRLNPPLRGALLQGRELLSQRDDVLTSAMTTLLQYGLVLRELLPGREWELLPGGERMQKGASFLLGPGTCRLRGHANCHLLMLSLPALSVLDAGDYASSSHHARWAAAFTTALAPPSGAAASGGGGGAADAMQQALAAAPRAQDGLGGGGAVDVWAVLNVAHQAHAWEVGLWTMLGPPTSLTHPPCRLQHSCQLLLLLLGLGCTPYHGTTPSSPTAPSPAPTLQAEQLPMQEVAAAKEHEALAGRTQWLTSALQAALEQLAGDCGASEAATARVQALAAGSLAAAASAAEAALQAAAEAGEEGSQQAAALREATAQLAGLEQLLGSFQEAGLSDVIDPAAVMAEEEGDEVPPGGPGEVEGGSSALVAAGATQQWVGDSAASLQQLLLAVSHAALQPEALLPLLAAARLAPAADGGGEDAGPAAGAAAAGARGGFWHPARRLLQEGWQQLLRLLAAGRALDQRLADLAGAGGTSEAAVGQLRAEWVELGAQLSACLQGVLAPLAAAPEGDAPAATPAQQPQAAVWSGPAQPGPAGPSSAQAVAWGSPGLGEVWGPVVGALVSIGQLLGGSESAAAGVGSGGGLPGPLGSLPLDFGRHAAQLVAVQLLHGLVERLDRLAQAPAALGEEGGCALGPDEQLCQLQGWLAGQACSGAAAALVQPLRPRLAALRAHYEGLQAAAELAIQQRASPGPPGSGPSGPGAALEGPSDPRLADEGPGDAGKGPAGTLSGRSSDDGEALLPSWAADAGAAGEAAGGGGLPSFFDDAGGDGSLLGGLEGEGTQPLPSFFDDGGGDGSLLGGLEDEGAQPLPGFFDDGGGDGSLLGELDGGLSEDGGGGAHGGAPAAAHEQRLLQEELRQLQQQVLDGMEAAGQLQASKHALAALRRRLLGAQRRRRALLRHAAACEWLHEAALLLGDGSAAMRAAATQAEAVLAALPAAGAPWAGSSAPVHAMRPGQAYQQFFMAALGVAADSAPPAPASPVELVMPTRSCLLATWRAAVLELAAAGPRIADWQAAAAGLCSRLQQLARDGVGAERAAFDPPVVQQVGSCRAAVWRVCLGLSVAGCSGLLPTPSSAAVGHSLTCCTAHLLPLPLPPCPAPSCLVPSRPLMPCAFRAPCRRSSPCSPSSASGWLARTALQKLWGSWQRQPCSLRCRARGGCGQLPSSCQMTCWIPFRRAAPPHKRIIRAPSCLAIPAQQLQCHAAWAGARPQHKTSCPPASPAACCLAGQPQAAAAAGRSPARGRRRARPRARGPRCCGRLPPAGSCRAAGGRRSGGGPGRGHSRAGVPCGGHDRARPGPTGAPACSGGGGGRGAASDPGRDGGHAARAAASGGAQRRCPRPAAAGAGRRRRARPGRRLPVPAARPGGDR